MGGKKQQQQKSSKNTKKSSTAGTSSEDVPSTSTAGNSSSSQKMGAGPICSSTSSSSSAIVPAPTLFYFSNDGNTTTTSASGSSEVVVKKSSSTPIDPMSRQVYWQQQKQEAVSPVAAPHDGDALAQSEQTVDGKSGGSGDTLAAKLFLPELATDPETLKQVALMSKLPSIEHPRFMPDTHKGFSCCVGFTALMKPHVSPLLIGGDIGCGVSAIPLPSEIVEKRKDKFLKKFNKVMHQRVPMGNGHTNIHEEAIFSVEQLQPFLNSATEELMLFASKFHEKFSCSTPSSSPHSYAIYPILRKIFGLREEEDFTKENCYTMRFFRSRLRVLNCSLEKVLKNLGTLGGGNHFLELDELQEEEFQDGESENQRTKYLLVVHSGSRCLGQAVYTYWADIQNHPGRTTSSLTTTTGLVGTRSQEEGKEKSEDAPGDDAEEEEEAPLTKRQQKKKDREALAAAASARKKSVAGGKKAQQKNDGGTSGCGGGSDQEQQQGDDDAEVFGFDPELMLSFEDSVGYFVDMIMAQQFAQANRYAMLSVLCSALDPLSKNEDDADDAAYYQDDVGFDYEEEEEKGYDDQEEEEEENSHSGIGVNEEKEEEEREKTLEEEDNVGGAPEKVSGSSTDGEHSRIFSSDRVINSTHNYIDFTDLTIRKGAIQCHKGQQCLVALNARDGIWLCEGKGNADWNYSGPHGCGRDKPRSSAAAAAVTGRNNTGRSKGDLKRAQEVALSKYHDEMEGVFSSTISLDTYDERPSAYRNPALVRKMLELGESLEIQGHYKTILSAKGGSYKN